MSTNPPRTPPRTMVISPKLAEPRPRSTRAGTRPPHPLAASSASIIPPPVSVSPSAPPLCPRAPFSKPRGTSVGCWMRWVALPVGIVGLVVRLARRAAEPRHAAGCTWADPPRPVPVPAALAVVALVRPAQEDGSIQGTGLVCGGPRPFLPSAGGWVSLALLGFALDLWSPAFVHGLGRTDGSFDDALYAVGLPWST